MNTYVLLKPLDEDMFEDIVCDIFAREYRNPNLQRYGVRGQQQYGIDVIGFKGIVGINHIRTEVVAIQCKNHPQGISASELKKEFDRELVKLDQSPLSIQEYVFVTSADSQPAVINHVAQRNIERQAAGKCGVAIKFWDFVSSRLSTYPDLLFRYYTKHLPTAKAEALTIADLNSSHHTTLSITADRLLHPTAIKAISEDLEQVCLINLGANVQKVGQYRLSIGISAYPSQHFRQQVDLDIDISALFGDVTALETKYQQMVTVLTQLMQVISNRFFSPQLVVYSAVEINFALLLGHALRRYRRQPYFVFKEQVWTTSENDVPVVAPYLQQERPVISPLNGEESLTDIAFVFTALSRTNVRDDVLRSIQAFSPPMRAVFSYRLQNGLVGSSAHALSVAKAIVQEVHDLELWGAKTVHLFLAVPKPLAALIGYSLNTLNSRLKLYFMNPERDHYLLTGILRNDTFSL